MLPEDYERLHSVWSELATLYHPVDRDKSERFARLARQIGAMLPTASLFCTQDRTVILRPDLVAAPKRRRRRTAPLNNVEVVPTHETAPESAFPQSRTPRFPVGANGLTPPKG